jgi:hypothetical protein
MQRTEEISANEGELGRQPRDLAGDWQDIFKGRGRVSFDKDTETSTIDEEVYKLGVIG